MHPLSRGSVHLASASDPSAPPTIDLGVFTHPLDFEMLKSGVKAALRIVETSALKNEIVGVHLPKDASTDEAIGKHIKETTSGSFHPLGTAAMLPRKDNGVVDENLKVYGTTNLRVVSAE